MIQNDSTLMAVSTSSRFQLVDMNFMRLIIKEARDYLPPNLRLPQNISMMSGMPPLKNLILTTQIQMTRMMTMMMDTVEMTHTTKK